jgi:hypothetical protein
LRHFDISPHGSGPLDGHLPGTLGHGPLCAEEQRTGVMELNPPAWRQALVGLLNDRLWVVETRRDQPKMNVAFN